MFPIERQQKLDPILAELRLVEGIEGVWQDDFDSTGINVFFLLTASKENEGAVMEFVLPLVKVRRRLKKLFRELGVDFRVIDKPEMRKEYTPIHSRFQGDPLYVKVGYDQQRYGIEVFV